MYWYHVITKSGASCGHRHETDAEARNCAESNGLEEFTVSMGQETASSVKATICPKCGQDHHAVWRCSCGELGRRPKDPKKQSRAATIRWKPAWDTSAICPKAK